LEEEVIITPKDSPAAKNRFIYYPDRLVRMPGPGQDIFDIAWSVMTEPVFKGLLSGVLFEHSRPPRSAALKDESVASFLERRLGSPLLANNMVSAVLHGIYAGDITKLSIRSLLPSAWYNERCYGSLSRAYGLSMRNKTVPMRIQDAMLLTEMTKKPGDIARASEMNFACLFF